MPFRLVKGWKNRYRVGLLLFSWLLALVGCEGGSRETSSPLCRDEARRLLSQGRAAEAESSLRPCLEGSPRELSTHLLLLQSISAQGEIPRFRVALNDLLNNMPSEAPIEDRLSLVRLIAAGPVLLPYHLDVARAQIDEVLAAQPDHPVASFYGGLLDWMLGRTGSAVQALRSFVDRFPAEEVGHLTLGAALLREGAYAEAAAHLEEATLLGGSGAWQSRWLLALSREQVLQVAPNRPRGAWPLRVLPEPSVVPVTFEEAGGEAGVAKVDAGRGSGWADYDGDGDLDLLAVGNYAPHALYRNEGDGRFTEVAEEAGLADARGGWGALWADYDNDGDPDLYVTRDGWFGSGPNSFYRNNGDGTFTEVTEEAGVADHEASSFAAAWADYDRDGDLDLYVANGVAGDGSPNALFRNQGGGQFTEGAGVARVALRAQSVGTAWGDYDGDGWPDLFVATQGRHVLYRNQGDGTFREVTEGAGIHPASGKDAFVVLFFDYDNDLDLDIFVSTMAQYEQVVRFHLGESAPPATETSTLYRNDGDGTFSDMTAEAGLGGAYGAMGGNVGDIDNDGHLDLYLGNGGPDMERLEPDAFFWNQGDGRFLEQAGPMGLSHLGKSHGVTFADYDEDGDLDIYVPIGGAYRGDQWANAFFRNRGTRNHWLGLRLVGTRSNRDAIGARILAKAGPRTLLREVSGGEGFGSTSSRLVHLGLGRARRMEWVEIHWPSGVVERLTDLPADRVITLVEGRSQIPETDSRR